MKANKHMELTRNTLLYALLVGVGAMVPLQQAQAADVTIGGKEVTVWNSFLGIPYPAGSSGGLLNAPGGVTTTNLTATGTTQTHGITNTGNIVNTGDTKTQTLEVTGASTTHGITNTGNIVNTGDTKTQTLEVTGASTTHGITNTGNIVNTGDTKTQTLEVTGASTTHGITNTGNIVNTGDTKTQTLQVTNNANVGGDLNVTGMSNTHGINNNGQRIQNVGAAVAGTDAVNLNQLNEGLAENRKYVDNGVAAALAIPSMPVLAPGKGWAGMAVGNYGSATAVGLAVGYQVNERWNLGLGVSQGTRSGSKTAVKAQAGFSW